MEQYTILCTEEQTRKALELGAPIKEAMSRYNSRLVYERITQGKETRGEYNKKGIAILGKRTYNIPTAEQMFGWLEEQGFVITISNFRNEYGYSVSKFENNFTECIAFRSALCSNNCPLKKATLAAIDAALEYLTNQKIK